MAMACASHVWNVLVMGFKIRGRRPYSYMEKMARGYEDEPPPWLEPTPR